MVVKFQLVTSFQLSSGNKAGELPRTLTVSLTSNIDICMWMVNAKIAALKGNQAGESRNYCSDKCKAACPTYNQQLFPKDFKHTSSREAQPILRQFVLERDNYTCQICFKNIPDIELHCYHILGYKQNRAYAEDPDNCASLCKACHTIKKGHKLPGCNYKDLRCKNPTAALRISFYSAG